MGEKLKQARNKRTLVIAAIIVVAIGSLMFITFIIESRSNRLHSYQTLTALVDQIEQVLDTNEKRTEAFTKSLKEEYIARAHAVSYILEKNPKIEDDVDEIKRVANLVSIDEIHVFDETGHIIAGTNPEHFGLSFDDGEQISYFKPMLEDKTLEMCQDMTPNTGSHKSMMYAICWNDAGTRMVQVGIEPVRLLVELKSISVPEVVASLGLYNGVNVFVVNASSGLIEGSNISGVNGKTLASLGIDIDPDSTESIHTGKTSLRGEPSYMAAHTFGSHLIICTQSIAVANADIGETLVLVFLYLVVAVFVIVRILQRMTKAVLEEHRNATEDSMTELSNRRAYEKTIEQLENAELDEHLVYVSLDLNGLKVVNDTLGHEMGDKLICGCSCCIRSCFGHCGELFRIGGDEFAAIIYAREDELDALMQSFEETQKTWSAENGLELSISWGLATARHHPHANVSELAQIADAKMYEAKHLHYEKLGKTPRSTQANHRR